MHFFACFLHYSSKTCPFHFYSLSFPPCNPMPNILEWKYQHRNCLHTWIINSISGENAITLVISWVLSPLDRCIIRVLLKKTPRYKIRSIYLVSCRLCNGYCSPPSSPQPCFEALKWMNTHQVAFVVYKTPGQKHCWTDLLHCPFQRWNPRDQILDPICKTRKQINSDVPSSCFPAAFPVQGSWGKKRTQILTWFMWCSPGKLSSNRGSTGHSWLKLLDTPGAAEELHWTPALLLLGFGAVLSHHFLPPVTAVAALCTTVNWTQGHHKAEARICSTPCLHQSRRIRTWICSSGGTQICQAHELSMAPPRDPQPLFVGALAQCDTWNQHLKSLQSDFQLCSDKAESSTSPTKLLLQKEEGRLN